jgi:hypothetical protein
MDDEATGRYLTATRAALVAGKKSMPSISISIDHLVRNTERQCPAVAAEAPRNSSRWPVEVSITETLLVAADHTDARAIAKLSQTVNRLRWTTPRLTHLVRREVIKANAVAHRKLPNLCSGLREWARSRFQQVPPVLKQFIHEVAAFSEGSSVLNALSKYESWTERREVERLGRTVEKALRARILSGRMRLFSVVGLRSGSIPTPDRTGTRPRSSVPADGLPLSSQVQYLRWQCKGYREA